MSRRRWRAFSSHLFSLFQAGGRPALCFSLKSFTNARVPRRCVLGKGGCDGTRAASIFWPMNCGRCHPPFRTERERMGHPSWQILCFLKTNSGFLDFAGLPVDGRSGCARNDKILIRPKAQRRPTPIGLGWGVFFVTLPCDRAHGPI